jgi:hypothetical protein
VIPGPPFHNFYIYDNFVYHDPTGVTHNFSSQLLYDPTSCYDTKVSTFTETAYDGSGLTLTATGNTSGVGSPTTTQKIATRGGGITVVPSSSTSHGSPISDSNGNEISVSSSGVYTDTLGSTVMAVSGTPPSNVTYTYPTPSGSTATYTAKYTSFTIKTNFGRSGISEYTASSTPLITEIDLPDSSKYLFTYEATPGYSGDVTGRLATATLPTGGQIAYTYTGGSNGIVCADGSDAGLTRVLSNDPAGST